MTLHKLVLLLAAAIMLAIFVLIIGTAHAAPWIACKTDGKTWRLIDGRRCWTERHHPKSALYWSKRKTVPRSQGAEASGSGDRRPNGPTDEPETVEPPKHLLVHELVAQLQTAQIEVEPPRPVRTVLASPLLPVEIIPLPRPRPQVDDPPRERPIFAPHWGLLLALLMLGNAAAGDYD